MLEMLSKFTVQPMIFDIYTVYVAICYRVAVLVWPVSCFWVNTAQLKSLPKLYAKQIQTDGYDVVVVSLLLSNSNIE